jgi:hypothetical protein
VSRGNYKVRYQHLADEDLMLLVGGGDADAFAALYERHCRSAYTLARRVTGNAQDAEDLVQDVFLKLWRSVGSYRVQRGSVRTWMLRGPQSGHRPAALAGVPSEDAGEGRGSNGTTERSLRRDLAQIPTGSGARSPPGPPARAVQDPRAPPLLRPDERRDSRTLLPAARHCEGAHEARTKEAAQSP